MNKNINIKFLDKSILPKGFSYPEPLLKILKLNIVDFNLWYIMDNKQMLLRYEGLKERYPNRVLIPFAKRDDNDDIACFEFEQGEKVQIIHDYASFGYEQKKFIMIFGAGLEMQSRK